MKVSTQPGQPIWNSLTLNSQGEGFDVVRFRSPLSQPADMAWCFAAPKSLGAWYITPSQGDMDGFHTYTTEHNILVAGADLPSENVVIFQPLTGAAIRPGVDYYLWFHIEDKEPRDVDIAITLLPAGTTVADFGTAAIAQTMGIKYELPKFKEGAAGVGQAFAQARSLFGQGAADSESFHRALRQVAGQLPKLDVGKDGKVIWGELKSDAASKGFAAYRISIPQNEALDLQGMLVEPRPSSIVWGLLGPEYSPEIRMASLDVDLETPSASLPAKNLSYVWSVPRDQLEPGQDFVLWAADLDPSTPAPIALHFAANSSTVIGSRALAKSFGIEIPDRLSSERLKATLALCDEWATKASVDDSEVRLALQSAASSLPEFKPTTDGRIVCHRLPLGADGVGLAAIQCPYPEGAGGDLYVCFSDVTRLNFQVSSPNRAYQSARMISDLDGDFREFDSSETDPAVGALSGAGYCLMKSTPGQQNVMWFFTRPEARNQKAPGEVRFAISAAPWRFDPSRDYAAAEVNEWMGLHVLRAANPFGDVLAQRHDADITAIAFSKDGAQLASLDAAGAAKLWNVAQMKPGASLSSEVARTGRSVAFSTNGERLLAAFGAPVGMTSWKTSGGPAGAERKFAEGDGGEMALSADGALLAVAESAAIAPGNIAAGKMIVWDMKKSAVVREISTPGFVCEDLLLGERGLIAAGSLYRDGPIGPTPSAAILFFNPTTGQSGGQLITNAVRYTDVAVSPDNTLLAFAGEGGAIGLYRFDGGDLSAPILTYRAPRSVAFSGDGALLACGCADGSLQIWDLAKRKLRFERHADQESIQCVAFSPDDRWLASAGRDGAVRLWDLKNPLGEVAANSLGMKFVTIPAGEALMGRQSHYPRANNFSVENVDQPYHKVTLSRPIVMAIHEVTVGQFRAFVDATGFQTDAESSRSGGQHYVPQIKDFPKRPEFIWRSPGYEQSDEHPVVHISYNDATAFCKWLSEKEGKKYRLPTEAEWEYACRAGSERTFSYTDNFRLLPNFANVADQALVAAVGAYDTAADIDDGHAFAAPVGSYAPNAFGIYDMHGNVYEWCQDWYDPRYYAISPATDPQGAENGTKRVQRGGSYFNYALESASSARQFDEPDAAQSWAGFRVVMEK